MPVERGTDDRLDALSPASVVGVLALAVLYVAGWRRARAPGEPHPPGYGRLALFAGGHAGDPGRAGLADRRASATS